MMKELLENAGFEVSKKEETIQKTKSEEEILREKAQKGEILSEIELIKLGFNEDEGLLTIYSKNNVEFIFYGSELSRITLDGKDIEKILDIREATGLDDELVYRITPEALIFAYKKANII